MKKIFSLMCGMAIALFCTNTMMAQNEASTATLQHGETVQVFNGASALINANAAAVDGDVITLSEGVFNTITITKSIAIYGAGFEADETTGTAVSTINGAVGLGISGQTLAGVHLEGLYINGNLNIGAGVTDAPVSNLTITKVSMGLVYPQSSFSLVYFDQCILRGGIDAPTWSAYVVADNMFLTNCFLTGRIGNMVSGNIKIDHCVLGDFNFFEIPASVLVTNTVMYYPTMWAYAMPSHVICRNCICPQTVTGENIYQVELGNIFADAADAAYTPTRTFELQQPETWVGTDGTEIGIRGGNGWGKMPATPVVKNLQLQVNGAMLNVTYDAEVR